MEAYPLQWPVGFKRTTWPGKSKFDTTFAVARDLILKELKMLGATSPIISTNIPLRQDGLPYASYRPPTDKGVAVYFTYNREQHVLACDKWNKIEDNMQAIRKTVEAMRGLERWGVSDMLKRTFSGFKALPEETDDSWWSVLGISKNATIDEIISAYRKKAFETHPDRNSGNSDKFLRIKKAYDAALLNRQPHR
jgi:hypothetical protein